MNIRIVLLVALGIILPQALAQAPLRIAVASNFVSPLKAFVSEYQAQHPSAIDITVSIGSTGKLYAQIKQGAPFDLFFAADRDRPMRLNAEGISLGPSVPYTVGQLALWHPNRSNKGSLSQQLQDIRALAMANPALAPYGLAAKQTLETVGWTPHPSIRVARAENVGQVFALVATGNADAGFVARSQILEQQIPLEFVTMIPSSMHEPIAQHAVVLTNGRRTESAQEFLEAFLASIPAVLTAEDFSTKRTHRFSEKSASSEGGASNVDQIKQKPTDR